VKSELNETGRRKGKEGGDAFDLITWGDIQEKKVITQDWSGGKRSPQSRRSPLGGGGKEGGGSFHTGEPETRQRGERERKKQTERSVKREMEQPRKNKNHNFHSGIKKKAETSGLFSGEATGEEGGPVLGEMCGRKGEMQKCGLFLLRKGGRGKALPPEKEGIVQKKKLFAKKAGNNQPHPHRRKGGGREPMVLSHPNRGGRGDGTVINQFKNKPRWSLLEGKEGKEMNIFLYWWHQEEGRDPILTAGRMFAIRPLNPGMGKEISFAITERGGGSAEISKRGAIRGDFTVKRQKPL